MRAKEQEIIDALNAVMLAVESLDAFVPDRHAKHHGHAETVLNARIAVDSLYEILEPE